MEHQQEWMECINQYSKYKKIERLKCTSVTFYFFENKIILFIGIYKLKVEYKIYKKLKRCTKIIQKYNRY